MLCPKKVTEKKLAANRQNAKQSTGPRTERGKSFSKFNPIKYALFAKYIVIPHFDPEPELFSDLLDDLTDEFHPVGPIETNLVVQLANGIWKMRRAIAVENAMASVRALRHDPSAPASAAFESVVRITLKILSEAQKEIDATGTLSSNAYNLSLTAMQIACPAFAHQRVQEHRAGLLNSVLSPANG